MSSNPGRKTLRFITVRKEEGRLPATLLKEINDKVGLRFDPTEIVAMHRIPGKHLMLTLDCMNIDTNKLK
jgi:hypothetical protein